jgi:hypothetical protein
MQWHYRQLVADELGDPEGVLMFDETSFVKKGKGVRAGRAAVLWHAGEGREWSSRGVC